MSVILTGCEDNLPIQVEFPVDCKLGKNCWVIGYVDVEPGPDAKDYNCGRQTYDGSFGTQITIQNTNAMRAGVPVRAAAPGVVERIFDGMPDIDFRKRDLSKVSDRRCGNSVTIDHGDGWTSQYCHMRRGSVGVRTGQTVDVGDVIGQVGMSGRTFVPQLLFAVKHEGKTVDPFTGRIEPTTCDWANEPLWNQAALEAMPYEPVTLHNIGVSDHMPTARHARRNGRRRSGNLSRFGALALWVDIFFAEENDLVHFSLIDPRGGTIIDRTVRMTKKSARQFYYVAKRRKSGGWESGAYKGIVTLTRRTEVGEIKKSAVVEARLR